MIEKISIEKSQEEFKKYTENHKLRNLWQSENWYNFQKNSGKDVKAFIFKKEGEIIGSCLYLINSLPFGQKWIYIPRGPLFEDEEYLKEILGKIKKEDFIYAQIEFPFLKEDIRVPDFFDNTKKEINPSCSLVIDLKESEDEILSQMKPKGRYNIRLAEKKGVKVFESKDLDSFYDVLIETKSRDKFGIHPKSFYKKMLRDLDSKLFLAKYKEKIISGAILVFYKDKAIYYYGASSNKFRNLMAPYLVQWKMILESKKKGKKEYDFLGIAPNDCENHELKGVTEFKKKFGGKEVNFEEGKVIIKKKILYLTLVFLRKIRKIFV